MFTKGNKTNFEKWFKKSFPYWDLTTEFVNESGFYDLPFRMQIGVILSYYDSLGIYINTSVAPDGDCSYSMIRTNPDSHSENFSFKDRDEAHNQAFLTINSLINKE